VILCGTGVLLAILCGTGILLAIDIGAVLHPKRIHAQNIILNKLNLF